MLRTRTFIIVVGLMLAQVANADVDWGLALTALIVPKAMLRVMRRDTPVKHLNFLGFSPG